MATTGKMDPDLVGATRGEAAFHQRNRGLVVGEGAIPRQRELSSPGYHSHALSVPGIAADRALDLAGCWVRQPPGQGQVGTIQVAGGEGGRERGESKIRL